MGLKGAALGGVAGWVFGGPLGALFGALFGNSVENRVDEEKAKRIPRYRSTGNANRDLIFCASAAAMLAKIAKADGTVTAREIPAIEKAFARLGFSKATREYAVSVFRKAKDDRHTIYEYAYNFANAVSSVEIRELLYELLWDVACADGTIGSDELTILRQLPLSLGIRPTWFEYYARQRIAGYGAGRHRQSHQAVPPAGDPLSNAYELLGVRPSDDVATLKKAYRDLAKKFHPDALRAQGLPEEMIGKANERMAKINAAWTEIKSARGI